MLNEHYPEDFIEALKYITALNYDEEKQKKIMYFLGVLQKSEINKESKNV